MHGSDLRHLLAIRLADIKHVCSPETCNRSGGFFLILFILRLAANDGSKNQDAFFALLHEPAEFVPRTEAGDVAGIGLLRSDQHDVVEAVAVEAPDGFEISRKRLTVTSLQRSNELLCGFLCDFLDLF